MYYIFIHPGTEYKLLQNPESVNQIFNLMSKIKQDQASAFFSYSWVLHTQLIRGNCWVLNHEFGVHNHAQTDLSPNKRFYMYVISRSGYVKCRNLIRNHNIDKVNSRAPYWADKARPLVMICVATSRPQNLLLNIFFIVASSGQSFNLSGG